MTSFPALESDLRIVLVLFWSLLAKNLCETHGVSWSAILMSKRLSKIVYDYWTSTTRINSAYFRSNVLLANATSFNNLQW